MVAKRHKITNVPLFKKMLLSRKKRIMSRIFLNSGTLIVIASLVNTFLIDLQRPGFWTKYYEGMRRNALFTLLCNSTSTSRHS